MTEKADKTAEFDEVWETLELAETIERADATETLRPETRGHVGEGEFDVDALPTLTRSQLAGEMPHVSLGDVLGRGGMGEVHLAQQLPLARDVAVKSLRKNSDAVRAHDVEMLLRESWVTGRLEHPNIVPVHALGRNERGEPLLVLKKIEGVSWAELLEDPEKSPRDFDSDRPLDWHLQILSEVCDAVHFAHSTGIIHRDIKPENVMIGAFGEIYLLDWGVAVSLEPDDEGRLPTVADESYPAGTPAYMAPELVSGDGSALSPATDVYLLGAVLHQVLTGAPPNRGDSIYEIMLDAYTPGAYEYGADIHPELAEICRRAMRYEPDERFESAEALRKAIAHHRHHRESIRISRDADRRLRELREAVDEEANDAEVYEIFGECRFGFAQALRVSSDNERAEEGLQEVLELMAERELERGALEAASLLINELPRPNRTLESRLRELEEDLESRQREYDELKEMRREQDIEVGRLARSVTMLLLGVVWATTVPFFPEIVRFAELQPSPAVYLLYAAPIGSAVFVALGLMRDRILQNRANRTFTAALILVCSAGVSMRALGIPMALELPQIISIELAVYGVGTAVAALTLDSRLTWAAVPCLAGAIATAIVPGWAFGIYGMVCLAAVGLLVWAWWPEED